MGRLDVLRLGLIIFMFLPSAVEAQDDSSMSEQTSSSSSSSSSENSSSSSSSSNSNSSSAISTDSTGGTGTAAGSRGGTAAPAAAPAGATQSGTGELRRPSDNGAFAIPTERTSIKFVPKFKQRLTDLADQIRLAQSKGFITSAEASKFMQQQAATMAQEEEISRKGFPKPEIDSLEKAITQLNAALFAAMHKDNPLKPGQAEKEVNDPNLIPAYPDKDLQPGSGHVDPKEPG